MISTPRKTGRRIGYYVCADGTRVNGLTHTKSGLWRISATKKTFVEPVEALAVARFYELTKGETNRILLSSGSFPAGHPAIEDTAQNPSVHAVTEPDGRVTLHETMNELEFFTAVRYQLLNNLNHVAQMTGIPALLQLANDMPKPSPKLQELIDIYTAKPGLSPNEISRSKLFWEEFTKATSATTVREIDHAAVIRYETKVTAGRLSPKSLHHRYGKVRTILAYAIKRGTGIADCRAALDATAMLEVKNHNPLDPKPITPEQFWKIHGKAVEAGDEMFATLMLTALNMAAYGGEVSALRWDEVNLENGEVVCRRPKTGVSRVAILWPEVLAGLKKLPRLRDQVFFSIRRSFTANLVVKTWMKYREAAGYGKEVTFSQLRDASFTIAHSTSLDQARVLAGHRLPGASDNYIRRSPQFVSAACTAIRDAFYPPKKPAKQ